MNFKELYQIAKTSLEELRPLDEADFRLEQAEYNEKDETWDIVVSFLVENINIHESPITHLRTGLKFERIYKKLKIDKNKNVKGLYMFENA